MRQRFAFAVTFRPFLFYPLVAVDAALSGALIFVPNLLMGMNMLHAGTWPSQGVWFERARIFLLNLDLSSVLLWASANIVLLYLLLALRNYVFYPMVGMMKQVYGMLGAMAQDGPRYAPTLINLRAIAGDMARMAQLAQEYYHKHQDAQQALTQVRAVLAEINRHQRTILDTASRQMMVQYQSVLAYANYLEEKIVRQAIDPALRYDFDDVSESSFNLKLIAGSLSLIETEHQPALSHLDIPELLQQTMLALAPSLDRRAMKLTTMEVDLAVVAYSDPTIIAHVLWMLLLGTVRYAADESTLRLRCLYNRDHSRALISIVVSELSPGRLTEDERGTHLGRQMQHLTPHMFAETIRIHANIQLAEMMMKQLDGDIAILPLTSQSCEICLTLPVPAAPREV